MNDPAALRQAKNAGIRAKAILDDPLVVAALKAMEDEAVQQWAGSRLDDVAVREDAWRMLRAVRDFRSRIERHISDGAVAEAVIETQERAERRKEKD
jgi:cystathionine beta-lyase/cystathionine gamma-synthase